MKLYNLVPVIRWCNWEGNCRLGTTLGSLTLMSTMLLFGRGIACFTFFITCTFLVLFLPPVSRELKLFRRCVLLSSFTQ